MSLRTIVYDFDGVIADNGDFLYALAQEADPQITDDDFVAHHDGNVYEEPRIRFTPESAQTFFAEYGKRLNPSHIAAALPTVTRLSKQYQQFIISSGAETNIHAVLREAGITNCFAAIYGYDTHTSKVAKFKLLKERFGIDYEETVFITDTLGDIKEGNELGIKVIAETFGVHPRERLEQGAPYAICDTWDEIEAEISKLA